MPIRRAYRRVSAAAVIGSIALAIAACGGDDSVERGEGPSTAQPSPEIRAEGLPRALARNVKQGDQIVGEGVDAFERRLQELRGHPVVSATAGNGAA
jgi:hypothetical protein